MTRCLAEIEWHRRFVMSGEPTPYCSDPADRNARLADAVGALIGMTDWEIELELIRNGEAK
jgi:hypothetical protein